MSNIKKYISYSHMPVDQLKSLADSGSDVFAQYAYGCKLVYDISGHDKDLEDIGVEYINRAAQNGCAEAEHWMADEYLDLSPNAQAPETQEKGISFLKSATLKGHFQSAIALGYVHFNQGPMHSPAEAMRVWTEACDRNETSAEVTHPESTGFIFCNHLSDLFSKGAYGAPKQNELSSHLHILSNNNFVNTQTQKNVLLFLSELEVAEPELFERLQTAGLQWPTADVLQELLIAADQKVTLPEPIDSPKGRRIEICQSLLWVRLHHASISQELALYIKGKLPAEIVNIPNLKLALES